MLIMGLAAFLRAEYLLQIEHNVDHAYPIWQALQTLDRGVFPLTGQGTSVLFANPPLTGYLYLPFVALTRSPLGVYVFVIALNTLAVLLAFRAARLLAGANLALVAAFLMAVNPWVIEYSRTSWVQSLLPFWVCALAWALFPLLLGKAKHPARRLLIAFALLTGLAQSYLLGFLMIIPVGLLLLIFWRRVPKPALLFGIALFGAAALLYGAGLFAQRGTVEARLGEFGGNAAHFSSEALNHALRLVTGSDYALARGTLAPIADSALRQDLSNVAHVALVALLVVGVTAALWRLRQAGRERDRAIIVLVWFFVPILLMSYVGQVVHPFYQLLGLPAGYVLVAWGVGALAGLRASEGVGVFTRLQARVVFALVAVLLVPFGVLMGINSARYYQETAAIPGAHGLGALPLDVGLELGALMRERFPGMVYADVDEWILSSFTGETLDFTRDARAPAFNFIPPSGMYIAAYVAGETPAVPLGSGGRRVLALADGSSLVVDFLSQLAALELATTQRLHVSSDQGIALEGYELAAQGDTWTLITYWRVEQRVEGIDGRLFAPFAHIFDVEGNRVAIIDGQAVPGYEWRAGDLHAHRMTFTLPESGEPFTVRVGQYDAGGNLNAIFVLPDGEYTPVIELPEGIGD
jgi:4-amino-4-deoxy-L-arabinose transferase-like glycosyltransferase